MSGMVASAVPCLISQYLQLHKSTTKLSYISSSIFAGLVKEGFCTVDESQEDATGEGGGNFQEAEGTVRPPLLRPATPFIKLKTVLNKWPSAFRNILVDLVLATALHV